jgi:pimeloyl-ACP methyl ester carboxylesterase
MLTSRKSMHLAGRIFAMSAVFALVALVFTGGGHAAARLQKSSGPRPTIVLVHGNWADASSWNDVIERLQDRGFTVVAPPNTLRGPAQDAPYLASYLQTIAGPIVLVGHSYAGFVITNAATGLENVKALVYVDAFAPDENERIIDFLAGTDSCVTDSAVSQVPFDGGIDLYLRWEANPPYPGFLECFANGVDEQTARLLFAGQRPAAVQQFFDPSGPPAWKTIPSWAVLGTQDHVIPPALQEEMYERAGARVTRVNAGHLNLITRPDVVVRVIQSAVKATA